MLSWVFGDVQENIVHLREKDKSSGYLEFKNARFRWYLSIDGASLPKQIQEIGQKTYRSILIDGEEIEFSSGFTDLHTVSYQEILKGNGFGLADAKTSVEIVYDVRNNEIVRTGEKHPFCKK